MTDKEIGRIVREIVDRGNTAEVKRNKDGVMIIENKKSVIRKDKVS